MQSFVAPRGSNCKPPTGTINPQNRITRRGFLELSSAALATAGLLGNANATKAEPRNSLDAANPDTGMILSVDNIGIGVTNLGRSVEFYQRLGFAKAFENERGCTMVAGSAKLFLFVASPGRAPVARQAFNLSLNPVGIDHVSLLVDNVDKTHTELVARGIEFHTQPADQSWGARAAMLRDPDGTNIYLLSWLSK